MTEDEARAILQKGYGTSREDVEGACFGDCCLPNYEKDALLTLIYGGDK